MISQAMKSDNIRNGGCRSGAGVLFGTAAAADTDRKEREMPIKDLTGRIRPQRLGRVRLGRKREIKKGNKTILIPYATPYFVLDDMPDDVRAIYGEEPTTLNIHFLFNSIPDIFPNYHMFYLRRGLRCMGDGEIVLYRVIGKPEEPTVVIRGAAWSGEVDDETKEAWIEKYGAVEPFANTVACLGLECPVSQERDCRPTGRLCFAVQDYDALGYFDMRTSGINAIAGILGQLGLGMAMFGHITAIPWHLHLRPETVQVGGKGLTIYVPWVTIDPKWLQVNLPKRGLHLRAAEEERIGDIADLYGWEDVEDLAYDRTPVALLEEAKEGSEETAKSAQQTIEKTQVAIEKELKEMQPEDSDALWAYAKAKGIATGIVQTVLEETGGAIEETMIRLKERYGEVE